jgi:peptidyl-prolyl cis-trans isomerase D
MLGYFRDNIKKFAIFLWIAAIAFVIGGAYLFVKGPFTMGGNTAIKVGSTKISIPEYQKTYNNIYKFYIQLLTQIKGGKITEDDIKKLNIKQKTIDTLVQRTLLLQEAKKEGIKVSSEDVQKEIEKNTAFYLNGKFSKAKYLSVLKANNINPKDYEGSVLVTLYIDKLKKKIFKDAKVTPKEVRKYFEENYSTADLEYVYLPFDKLEKEVKINDKELKDYYSKHKEDFRVPTQLKFKYILYSLDYEKTQIKITDNDTKIFYDGHKSFFKVPTRIKVAHILVSKAKNDNETDAELKKKAEDVYKEIASKKISFKNAVKKFSSDTFTKKVGGELGYITKDMVVPGFWKGIENLKSGDISKPFKSKFGYHIAKVEAVEKPYIRKYKDVKKDIVDYLKEKQAEENLFIDAKRLFVKIRDSKKKFEEAATEFGFDVKTSGYMSLKSPKAPFNSAIVKSALMEEKGKLLGPDEGVGGYIIYEIADKKPSYIPAFDKIKDKVKKAYIKFKAKELAKQKAEEVYSKLKKGEKFNLLAKAMGIKVNLSKDISKYSPDDKMECTLREDVVAKIFENKAGFVDKCATAKGFYVYLVKQKKVKEEDFAKYKKSIYEQLKSQKEYDLMNNFIEKLKKQVKIEVNPKL